MLIVNVDSLNHDEGVPLIVVFLLAFLRTVRSLRLLLLLVLQELVVHLPLRASLVNCKLIAGKGAVPLEHLAPGQLHSGVLFHQGREIGEVLVGRLQKIKFGVPSFLLRQLLQELLGLVAGNKLRR